MEYNPKVFEGEHAQEIFSEVIHRNNTVEKNLVRVMDNIKNKTTVTSIEGEIPYSEYKEDIREADLDNYADSIKLEDSTVQPVKLMALTTFTMDDLRNSRFAKDMSAGAANITSNEFEQAVLTHAIPRLGKSFEKIFWNSITATTKATIAADATIPATQKAWAQAQPAGFLDGVIASMIVTKKIQAVAGGANSVATLATEYGKVFSAIPSELFDSADLVIFAPLADKQAILQANASQTYRDIFTVAGDSFAYLGTKIEFVPIPAGMRLSGRSQDIILATDLLSDINTLEIGKVNNVGDKMFLKQVCTLDATVVVPSQKQLYIGS
ncbi:hypothetical protein [Rufibacter soli]